MNEDKKDNAEWARLIYRNQVDGIEAVKHRQWAATNYILLIFAAIIGYAELLNYINVKVAFLLLLLVFLVSIIGIYHLIDMQFVLTKYRKKLFNIADKKEYNFLKKIDMIADDSADFFKYFLRITVIFIALVLGGLTLVGLFLCKSVGNNFSGFSIGYYLAVFLFVNIILAWVFTCRAAKKAKEFDIKLDQANNVEG